MAEEKKEEAPEGEGAAKPKSKKMLFIIIGVVALLVLIGGGVAAFLLLGKKSEGEDVKDVGADAAEEAVEEGSDNEHEFDGNEVDLSAMFPMETFVVNLDGGRYIRLQIQVEFHERDINPKFYRKLVPIRDQIIELLASKREVDLDSSDGRRTLKDEIRDLINDTLKREDVKVVYFTQFIIQ